LEEAERIVEKLEAFDAMENVLTIFAHDLALLDIAGFFP